MDLKRLFKAIARLGVTSGMTFHTEQEEGVGMFVVPNPRPTRANLNIVPVESSIERRSRRVSGEWRPKLLHFTE